MCRRVINAPLHCRSAGGRPEARWSDWVPIGLLHSLQPRVEYERAKAGEGMADSERVAFQEEAD